MKHTILYVPGLMDKRKTAIWLQKQLFRSWSLFGNRVEIFRIGWAGDTPFAARLEALLTRISELKKQGSTVSLIGASAGASAVINAYAERKKDINGVVCICGALSGTESFPEAALTINPRFRESVKILPKAIKSLTSADRTKVMTMRPLVDGVVLPKNAILEGARNKRIVSFGHLFSIGYFVYGRNWTIWSFLKKQARKS